MHLSNMMVPLKGLKKKMLEKYKSITRRLEDSQKLSKNKQMKEQGLKLITGVCCANRKLGNGGSVILRYDH